MNIDHKTLFNFSTQVFTATATIVAGYFLASRPKYMLTAARLRSMMAIGAGFLLATVFTELLPLGFRSSEGNYLQVLHIVLGGVLTVFIFDRWITPQLTFFDDVHHDDDGCAHHHEYAHDHGHNHANISGPQPDHSHASCGHAIIGHGAACSAVGCLIVCAFFDGIAFSSALLKDPSLGALILTAQLFHVIPEGLLASSLILASDGSPKNAKRVALFTGVCFITGAMIPGLLTIFSSATYVFQGFFVAFASGILIYVGLSQLLPATYQSKRDSALVLAGGILFAVIHTIIGHKHTL